MKVACFSVATMDFFPQQKQHFAGGNSLNQAVRFRQMGHHSTFVGALGTDEAGDRITALLQAEAVDTSHMYRSTGHTACNQIINDEAGERYGVEGTWNGGVYEYFKLGTADWEYISDFDVWATHADGPNYREALQRKTEKQFMSVDFLHLKDYELLEKSLQVVNIVYFGGTPDMVDDIARIAAKNRGILILTLGAEGSIAFEHDRHYTQRALPLDKVIDTTGCGDAFQAACTATYLSTKDIQTALLAGAQLGRVAASHFGGIPWKS